MAAARAPIPVTQRIDQIPGALDAIFNLFEAKKATWAKKLPNDTTLQKDPEARRVMHELFSPIVLKRSQLQLQHLRWRVLGKPAAMAASSLSPGQIRSVIESRVAAAGGANGVIERAFAAVCGLPSLVTIRESVMPPVLLALKTDDRSLSFYRERVDEFIALIVSCYARVTTKVNSNSANLELGVYHSQQSQGAAWTGRDFVIAAFSAAVGVSSSALAAENLDHLKLMTYKAIDDALWVELRRCFGPSAGLGMLEIPPYDHSEQPHRLVRETLFYIAGAMLSALLRFSKRCARTMPNLSRTFTAFVAKHTLRPDVATAQGLPTALVKSRSAGSLLYASLDFYSLVIMIEHAYTALLTISNVVAYGGSLVRSVFDLTLKWPDLAVVFETCMAPLRNMTFDTEGDELSSSELLTKLLRLYMRIRGKDAVKTLMCELKLKSASVNAHRASLAAAASIARKRRKQERAENDASNHSAAEADVQSDDEPCDDLLSADETDTLNIDLEEVAGEFEAGDGDIGLDEESPHALNLHEAPVDTGP
jgi:hypothetical protein